MMPILTVAVTKSSAWILSRATGPRALAWSISVVATLSVVTATGALLTAELPEPESGSEGLVGVGMALGLFLGIGAGFVLWLYLAVGTYLALKVISRPPNLANLVRLVGVALILPLAGRVVSLAVQPLSLEWLPTTAYLVGVAWEVAVLSKAIAVATEIKWFTAAIGVVIPIAVTQVPGLVFRLL